MATSDDLVPKWWLDPGLFSAQGSISNAGGTAPFEPGEGDRGPSPVMEENVQATAFLLVLTGAYLAYDASTSRFPFVSPLVLHRV